MKKIAFKNFRRFENFPELEFGGISIMVGRNNSGKSTMVKALLLVLDYLQNQQDDSFSFANKVLEDVNIVTFGRAINNSAKKSEINFRLDIDNYSIILSISGNQDDTSARVNKLYINDFNNLLSIEINYLEKFVHINKDNFIDSNEAKINDLLIKVDIEREIEELEKELNKPDLKNTSPKALRIVDNLNKLKQQLNNLKKLQDKDYENQIYTDLVIDKSYPIKENPTESMTEESIIMELVSDFFYQNNLTYREFINKNQINDFDNQDDDNFMIAIEDYRKEILKSVDFIINKIKNIKIYYLGANPSKQSALFSLRDKQNNLAQAIHEFKQCKIESGEKEYEFVKLWMNEFEVGQDFHIEFYAGEAYEFYVIDKEGNKVHLADKGMGSLQAMMLILRVAIIMRKHKKNMKDVTIIVEEPELNLHPALQSKLADFFHIVNTEHGIEFIIETHSEYLVRKAQLFVAENQYTKQDGLNPNPFKVYYFDKENGPYEMSFRLDGRFTNEFGSGFFDVNSNLIFDLP